MTHPPDTSHTPRAATRRIALATAAHLPQLAPDDQRLLRALRERDIAAEPAVWDGDVRWTDFDAVVIRSCWRYYRKQREFVAWLHMLDSLGVLVRNPVPLVAWNTDKRYLRDLAARGVTVTPTVWIEPGGASPPLAQILRDAGWAEAVVKPAISAGAYQTWRIARGDEAPYDERIARLATQQGAAMVQPLVPEIVKEGEWSLVFLRGEFSHAALKVAAAGDFRVQTEHGGRYERREPPASLIADGAATVGAAAEATGVSPGDVLYARVDGASRDGRLLLMELECVEPALFFELDPSAAGRMAAEIIASLP